MITTAISRDRAAGPETAEVRGRALIAETILLVVPVIEAGDEVRRHPVG